MFVIELWRRQQRMHSCPSIDNEMPMHQETRLLEAQQPKERSRYPITIDTDEEGQSVEHCHENMSLRTIRIATSNSSCHPTTSSTGYGFAYFSPHFNSSGPDRA